MVHQPFENPLYYGARIQRWLEGGRFGIDARLHALEGLRADGAGEKFEGTLDGKPVPPKAKVDDYFDKLEWSHGHNMLTLNGLIRLPVARHHLALCGVGAGVSLPHSEIHLKTDPHRTYEYQYAGPTAQALFGLELRLRTGSIFIEYKFTIADYWGPLTGRNGHGCRSTCGGSSRAGGAASRRPTVGPGASLTSHQVIGGFLKRFVPNTPTAP